MVQLQISKETMTRMEKISGLNHARDGDYLINETLDVLEKKLEIESKLCILIKKTKT